MMIITLYLVFAMLATLWLDVTRYKIPNWLVGSLLLLYPVAVYISPQLVDWKMSLLGMLAVFLIGYGVFSMRWMAGGDVKLITVLALWVGPQQLIGFVMLFAIIGGVFSLLIIGARRIEPMMPWPKGFIIPRILQKDAPMPYGVAIASAFLWMMWIQQIPLLVVG